MSSTEVDVWTLAHTQQLVSGMLAVDTLKRLRPLLATGDGCVQFTFQGFIDAHQRPAAKLSLNTELPLICTHCEQPMLLALTVDKSYYFVRDELALNAIEVDMDADEPLIGSQRFDLAHLIEDELILALPLGPRHAECQAQLEARTPQPRQAERPEAAETSPFSALAGLKTRGGG